MKSNIKQISVYKCQSVIIEDSDDVGTNTGP